MNSLMNVGEVQTMSSREIAELTGKRHDNVLRDIDFIHSNLSESSKSVSYKGYNNQSQRSARRKTMNELINGNAIKMTSIEIAELVGKRHDNVKRTIETLAKNGVIRLPQIEVSERINNLGFNVQYEHYVFEGEQGKRDSIVVVAQLSPEFTARLVDRWRDLEEAAVNIPKTLPEALRLAADLAEQKMQLENQLALAAPKVEFADRVGEASGILIGNFAKVVGIGPNKLFAWMRDHKILIASGSRRNVPMQEYMDRGYFTVKETAVNTNHGIQISFTTKITGRGQQWLTRKLLDNGMLKVTGEAA